MHVNNRSAPAQQVPTESTIVKAVGPDAQIPIISAKVHHKDFSQSLVIVVRCLITLATWDRSRPQHGTLSLQQWMVDAVCRVRSLITWKKFPMPRTTFESICVDVMEVSRQSFFSLLESRTQAVACSRAIDVVIQITADLLMMSFEATGDPISGESQQSICWSLNAVASVGGERPLVWKSYHRHVGSLIFEGVQNTERLEKHSQDFQVRIFLANRAMYLIIR